MPSNYYDLIQSIIDKKPNDTEEHMINLLLPKLNSRVEELKVDVAAKMFNKDENESDIPKNESDDESEEDTQE